MLASKKFYNKCSENSSSQIVFRTDIFPKIVVGCPCGECGVVRYTTQFFVLDKAKALPIRIGSQTAWDAVRLDFIDNKEKVITKDYELHGRCHFLALCTVILETFPRLGGRGGRLYCSN